jgi:hypothetical protein
MEGLTKLLLISILDGLLAHDQSGRFCASWRYSPHNGFVLSALGVDGTPLLNFEIDSRLLNELRCRLSAEATAGAKP